MKTRSLFKRPEFLAVSGLGTLLVALVRVAFDSTAQLVVLGALISFLAGILIAFLGQEAERQQHWGELLKGLSLPVTLARHPDLFSQYSSIVKSLARLTDWDHPALRRHAHYALAEFAGRLGQVSEGILEFTGTESWRSIYMDLLSTPNVKLYRSVALIRSPKYWRDVAGENTVKHNLEMVSKGKRVERIAIIAQNLWKTDSDLLNSEPGKWLATQAEAGIVVSVVADSALLSQPELRIDFGIYGDDAVGIQELDDTSNTRKFTFYFSQTEWRLADERWRRLSVYARPLQEIQQRVRGL